MPSGRRVRFQLVQGNVSVLDIPMSSLTIPAALTRLSIRAYTVTATGLAKFV